MAQYKKYEFANAGPVSVRARGVILKMLSYKGIRFGYQDFSVGGVEIDIGFIKNHISREEIIHGNVTGCGKKVEAELIEFLGYGPNRRVETRLEELVRLRKLLDDNGIKR